VTPAEHHRAVAADFTARVVGTTDWDAPAPVDGWTARDVVDHLVTWLAELLVSRSLPSLPAGPSAAVAGVQALLDGPGADVDVVDPHLGGRTVGVMVDQIYTADVFMHTWDLARATGQDDTLDQGTCAAMLAGMEQMEDVIRASGQFGTRVDVPAGAGAQARLLGFIGRDPEWRPRG
jgi:uncharacterized protein (TIGR03086 family)